MATRGRHTEHAGKAGGRVMRVLFSNQNGLHLRWSVSLGEETSGSAEAPLPLLEKTDCLPEPEKLYSLGTGRPVSKAFLDRRPARPAQVHQAMAPPVVRYNWPPVRLRGWPA